MDIEELTKLLTQIYHSRRVLVFNKNKSLTKGKSTELLFCDIASVIYSTELIKRKLFLRIRGRSDDRVGKPPFRDK